MARAFKLTATRALERQEQAALFRYAALQQRTDPRWGMLFAIPNGTSASSIHQAVQAKATGLKKGVPDMFLAVAVRKTLSGSQDFNAFNQWWAGLFIEMKRKGGINSDVKKEQQWWISELRQQGYKAEVAFGWEHAVSIITDYLGSQK